MVCLGLLYLAAVILFTGNTSDGDITKQLATRDTSVIVIGAGVSGLAAARRLRQHGFHNITILEANDRIGGRADTIVFDESRFIELGAQFVHGEEDNAVYALASEKGLMHYVPPGQEDKVLIRTDQGTLVYSQLGINVRITMEEALTNTFAVDDAQYATVKDYLDSKLLEFQARNPTLDKKLTESLWRSTETVMEIYNGCDSFKQMSLASISEYRQAAGNNLGLLKKGYVSIVESLANDIPKESIRLLQKVKHIDTNSTQGVRVVTEDGIVYHADHVIVTVSLGVLKARANDLFIPKLPKRKLEAFQALGFGTVNKVFLQFENAFWDDGWKYLMLVWTGDTKTNSQLPWEHGISIFEVISTTNNTLMGWLTGQAARQMELKTDQEIISTCVKVLKQFTGIKSLPKVVAMKRSRWFSDENFRGSYSFRTVESNLISGLNNTLSEPLYGKTSTGQQNSPVVMFAGEHTHPYYYSTVHGALDSGMREATRVIEYYKDLEEVKSAQ